ncbi:type I-E CRISPR-associated protein Cas7/Cse4/CasC [Brevibacterium sp. BRM-1]|uniref:type I-E CRISPR-associated protein Cas7/Cse4/CasC n=1 Tax=Brevibacterium sp. BRM-1 TaxID=2999062 RepID=UPI002280139C|nr:type I-E CRISPR-associated protein Cas7/Cse4/CasC [Brevibacterium sp. BRM-1]WAL39139.1 type I-E CRISPR-associated protein Cas7/Cse4/CasC [Brevibacterium sp. BRM-1]
MSLFIDIHALQTLPPSNINRDDTGAPKTAVFGGVPRQRVSSQAWKRAIRQDFKNSLGEEVVGVRTKRSFDLVVAEVLRLTAEAGEEWTKEAAEEAVEGLYTAAKMKLKPTRESEGRESHLETGSLLFLSRRQLRAAAELVISAEGAKPTKKDADRVFDTDHSIDIAMFGRMVAEAPDYNVDASVQVAHALGVHESEPEFDYFTAVDDVASEAEETGAGMIGTIQMMSSTLYRFASVNLTSLAETLGDSEAARQAAVAFLRSFVVSLPTGKQNTFANSTLPELVYVTVRNERSVSFVNAFEEPIAADETSGRRVKAAEKLAEEAKNASTCFGFAPTAAFVIGADNLVKPFAAVGTRTTLQELAPQVTATLEQLATEGEDR